ncbi:MAG: sensor domain-containing diguanylate cyclase [Butyrivibrio sp.]|nr:sensor domain-containing diguanylate cyclase [Butyrivibrio sp.]
MSKKKSFNVAVFTFVATLAITTVLAILYLTSASSSRRERAQFIADSIGDRIEAEINAREYIARILEIEVIRESGMISPEDFQTMGEELFNDYLDVVSVTLAPDGIVNYIYPLNNGLAERTNLFDDPIEGIYADYSKMSGVPVINAPVKLPDDSYGIVIRRPIFLKQENSGSFWGFASITLRLSDFLNAVNIKALAEEGYEYKLTANNMITGDKQIIMEYSEKELTAPVQSMISTVGGDYWNIGICPTANWMNLHEILGAFAIAIVISALASFGASSYMSMKANAKELEILSYRDALTNLENPRSYHEHMEELTRKKLPFGVVFMDLNDFKQVNDTYGHDAGDALLNITAKRLQNSIREKDKAFRIGGDEFVVVIHGDKDTSFYDSVIARMRQNVARDVNVGKVTLKVSISAGYARFPEDGRDLESVVKKADEAMYENKRQYKAKKAAAGQDKGRGSR